MAFLIPTVGDNRGDSPLPQAPKNPYSSGYFSDSLSGSSLFRDNDRYAMGLVGEPLEGNSRDQFMRSMFNWGGSTGQNLMQTGGSATGQAMDYYSKLLSGNPAAMSQAIQPEAGAIRQQYDQLRKQTDQFAPMGGGRASTMMSLPYKQQSDIGKLLAQVRPNAALQLGGLGTQQQQIANQLLQLIIGGQMTGRGQDVQEHGHSMQLAGDMARDLTMGSIAAMKK